MTVNICVFVFAMSMEMLIFCVWLFKFDREAAAFQAIVSFLTLSIFGIKMLASGIAYGRRYFKSFVFALEFGIFAMDVISYATSISSIALGRQKDEVAYFSFFVAFMLLHAVRIFHIFYASARPPKIEDAPKDGKKAIMNGPDAIKTITGIWVGRSYHGMSFAAADLLESIHDLTPGFSLQLYASRDKPEDCEQNNPFVGCCDSRFGLKSGRPDWEDIMRQALDAAHLSSDGEGDMVGVFFCGSPAIALTLQHVGQEVTAEHQYNNNGTCKCRIRVHKENF